MNLHNQFYELREECWKQLEELVHKGADWYGEFPIKIGEIHAEPKGLRTIGTIFPDYCDITIKGIIADENYFIHPPKESEKDLNVITNKIKVIRYKSDGNVVEEIEPYILELQTLCTYISGGFKVYEQNETNTNI